MDVRRVNRESSSRAQILSLFCLTRVEWSGKSVDAFLLSLTMKYLHLVLSAAVGFALVYFFGLVPVLVTILSMGVVHTFGIIWERRHP